MNFPRVLHLLAFSLVLGSGCDDGGEEEEEIPDHERTDAVLAMTGDAAAGMTVFGITCGTAPCHGADGDTPGDAMMLAKPLSEEVPEKTDRELSNIILTGYESMPSQATLTDEQVADVIAFVRGEFG